MGIPIRIDDGIYEAAKKTAKAECRSIPGQIEFWAKVGKCALDNPDLPIDFVKDLLISTHSDRSLAEPFDFDEE
ncbi:MULTISPECIES: ParD-like family protein [unclassified Legionella]|uniref:ParD-like family protein n=1 Tax=unclassified Legionella TaxID=2622702 RepID=UPI001055CFA3|nr:MULTISPECIES: ParD-like family protein [unclassified Legionella]MDI9819912.1 ParD-like family protein [Legionella sp. PL877]